ncbi:MAG: hypothetical protein ACLQNE_20670 [Thermoguttaceae bacterium]
MIGEHWFWLLLVLVCVGWYSTITFYVAVRGFLDIKHMLKRLADQQEPADEKAPSQAVEH